MKKLIITIILLTTLSYFCFGQNQNETIEQESVFIEVYVNTKGKIFLYNEKISLTKLEIHIEKTEFQDAKFATVFPIALNPDSVLELRNEALKCNKTGTYGDEA